MTHSRKRTDEATWRRIGFLVVLFATCFACNAQAQVVPVAYWSAPGSTCVPADAPIKFNRHKVNLQSVQHAVDNIDLITLSCSLFFLPPAPGPVSSWRLGMTYRDSTGSATAAFVRARLYRVAAGGTFPILMAEVNSDSFAITGLATRRSDSFVHDFDFWANSYWVHVDLNRSSTSDIVVLNSVQLAGDTCTKC
jgi:hypothetical protein